MKSSDVTMGKASVALGVFLTGITLLYAHANLPQTEAVAASVEVGDSQETLAARFVETWRKPDYEPSTSDWYFTRSDARIETAGNGYAEIWEQDDRQNITWKRVFHGDRKVIEYATGQLRAERRLKDWSALATIFDRRMLAALEPRGATTVLRQPAERYQGRLGDQQVEVVWLTRQAIPAKIVRSNRDATYTLELTDLRATPDASWPSVSEAQIQEYEGIDGSDLGDREYDPFVRKVLDLDGGGHGGHSHGH